MKYFENAMLVICAALLSWVMVKRIGAYADDAPGFMISFVVLMVLLSIVFVAIYDLITFLTTGKRRD